MIRNIHLYRLPNGISASPEQLAEQLSRGAFTTCQSSQRSSAGWVEPHADTGLVYAQDQQRILCYQSEEKILPASYINRCAEAKAAEIEDQQGYKPGRKQMREIKENIEVELLPRAFTKLSRTMVWIDNKNGWLCIDASQTRSEEIIAHLHRCLDMLPQIALPHTVTTPGQVMTSWLASGEAPESFTIDRDCELRSVADDHPVVRYVRHNLDSEEVRNHIGSGKRATRIALTWADKISFILTESLEIRRIHLLDILTDATESAETADDLFAANVALFTGELAGLIHAVIEACGGEMQDMVSESEKPKGAAKPGSLLAEVGSKLTELAAEKGAKVTVTAQGGLVIDASKSTTKKGSQA